MHHIWPCEITSQYLVEKNLRQLFAVIGIETLTYIWQKVTLPCVRNLKSDTRSPCAKLCTVIVLNLDTEHHVTIIYQAGSCVACSNACSAKNTQPIWMILIIANLLEAHQWLEAIMESTNHLPTIYKTSLALTWVLPHKGSLTILQELKVIHSVSTDTNQCCSSCTG